MPMHNTQYTTIHNTQYTIHNANAISISGALVMVLIAHTNGLVPCLQLQVLCQFAQDLRSVFGRRWRNGNLSIEATRPTKSSIQSVCIACDTDHYDACMRRSAIESIHQCQQLADDTRTMCRGIIAFGTQLILSNARQAKPLESNAVPIAKPM
jgi:hypothetical protein